MKKLFIICLCAMVGVVAKGQDVMVVEKNDNTTIKFSIDEIKRVYFEDNSGDIPNPSNSMLS